MTTDDKIDFLTGQIDAIKSFMLASIETHQDLASLAKKFETVSEVQLGQVFAKSISEQYVQGLQSMIDDVQRFLDETKGP